MRGKVRTMDELIRKYTVENELSDKWIRYDMNVVKKRHNTVVGFALLTGALIGFAMGTFPLWVDWALKRLFL